MAAKGVASWFGEECFSIAPDFNNAHFPPLHTSVKKVRQGRLLVYLVAWGGVVSHCSGVQTVNIVHFLSAVGVGGTVWN